MSSVPRLLSVCLLLSALLLPAVAPAAVVRVEGTAYRVNGGPPVTAAWDIAERLAVSKDTAIVVMDKKAAKASLHTLMQILEALNVPTLFTKSEDYDILVKRGVLKPSAAP